MHTYARRKKLKQAKVVFAEDKITNLPDSILTHILSFLPTKNAIRTSILSTRWKSLWASVPTLYLIEYNETKENIFLDFVDRVLVRHMMPFLEEVDISGSYLPPHIESWISAAVEQNVRILRLDFYRYNYKETFRDLPQSLFSLNRIVTLDLDVRVVLSFPVAYICFPNLKFLQLSRVIYEDDNSAQNLISSCPVLEELVINRDGFDDLRTLNVISRSLKILSLFYGMLNHGELDHVPKVVIDCPAVEYIEFEDDVTGEYVVRDLSSLIKAKLCVSDGCRPFQQLGTFAMHIFELLRRISSVKVLSLSSFTMSSLSTADDEILPTFHNLTCLEFDAFEDSEWNWKEVTEFLKSTPILEVLIFEGFSFSHEEFPTSPYDVPNCLLSHLKTIKVNGFLGKNDVEKVRFFLENAKVLEDMTVKLKGGEELLQLPRSSRACQLYDRIDRRYVGTRFKPSGLIGFLDCIRHFIST